MSENNEKAENFILSIGAGVMGLTLVYAIATDLFGLGRPGSRTVYLLCLLCLSIALVVRLIRLRCSGITVLIGHLPPMHRGDERKYFGWLLAAAGLSAYSVYEIAIQDGGVFIPVCVVSTILMLVLAVGLARKHA
jgi:hypothetical protein